jgi:hypothetical protein
LGTAIVESKLKYRKQIGGPALGLFQMEPNTHNDIWNNFLKYRDGLRRAIIKIFGTDLHAKDLENNDDYATIMARIHYLRTPEKNSWSWTITISSSILGKIL